MMYSASLYAYDVMSNVQVGCRVISQVQAPGGAIETVLEASTTFSGVGEPDPRQWLEDVLVALLERL